MGRRYGRKEDLKLSDLDFIWDNENSDWRLTSFQNVLTLMQNNLTFPDAGRPEANTQYSSPTSTGFSVQIGDGDSLPYNEDTHLLLLLSSALAEGTIVFPANAIVRDKQIITINVTNQITSLTLDINGASGIYGNISSMGADDFVSYKYDSVQDAWFRIS